MDWGKIIVEATGVALIGAAGVIIATLLANLITDVKGYKKIAKQIGNTDDVTLSGQHKILEKAITEGHGRLTSSIKETINKVESKVEGIDRFLNIEAKTKEMLYQSLDKDQQEIKRHVEGINALVRNWEEVNARNKELEMQVSRLENQINGLKAKIHILERKDRGNRDRGDD